MRCYSAWLSPKRDVARPESHRGQRRNQRLNVAPTDTTDQEDFKCGSLS